MEADIVRIRAKQFRGKWCSRRRANRVNDIINSLPKPDRTRLYEEAAEFEKYVRDSGVFRMQKT